jgi:hypothetical protein
MMYDITFPMRVIIRENFRGNRSSIKGIRAICLGCVLILGSCQTVEKIGYWDQGNSESTDSATVEPESDTPGTDSDTSEETEDTTVPSDTLDTSDTGSESASEDTEDSETSTDSDTTPTYVTVPFKPHEDAPWFRYPVDADGNEMGLPGLWIAYMDMTSPGTMNLPTREANGDMCFEGEIGTDPSEQTYAGVGINLCPDEKNQFNFYSFQNCPYTEATEGKLFVGVSYYVESEKVPENFTLRIWRWGTPIAVFSDVEIGSDVPRVYLFEALSDAFKDNATTSDITMLQFQVDGSPTDTVEFNFCIRDFALLIAEE